MNLTDFLENASADNHEALVEAQEYTETSNRTISSDVMTMLVVGVGLYGYFLDCSNDTSHPARDMCLALMDRIRTQSTFNFDPNRPKGAANRAMLDTLINTSMTEKEAQLTQLLGALSNESQYTNTPFARTQLDAVLAVRNPGVEQEVEYPGAMTPYLVTTAAQGIDVGITLTEPAAADLNVEVFIATCSDTNEQDIPDNFLRQELSIGYISIRSGNTRGALALSNRKARTYNKLFVKPNFAVDFSAQVRNNRG